MVSVRTGSLRWEHHHTAAKSSSVPPWGPDVPAASSSENSYPRSEGQGDGDRLRDRQRRREERQTVGKKERYRETDTERGGQGEILRQKKAEREKETDRRVQRERQRDRDRDRQRQTWREGGRGREMHLEKPQLLHVSRTHWKHRRDKHLELKLMVPPSVCGLYYKANQWVSVPPAVAKLAVPVAPVC